MNHVPLAAINTTASQKGKPMQNILITTKHRGVFFAQAHADADLTGEHIRDLQNCRMAIRFGTQRGVVQLAETGPTDESRISAAADMVIIHDVTAVFRVTDEAAQKWLSA